MFSEPGGIRSALHTTQGIKLLLSQESCFVGVTLCFSIMGDRGGGEYLASVSAGDDDKKRKGCSFKSWVVILHVEIAQWYFSFIVKCLLL